MATKNLVPRNSGEGQLGTTGKAWGSGYYNELYVTGAAGWIQLTGGAGGGSSLWSENGTKIYYNTDNVGIGTTNPAALLHVSGDQYQVQISGPDGQNKFIKINSSLGDNFVGFSESQNALMMLADDDAPVYIGQVSHQAIRVDKNGDRGSVVIGDDASRPAAGDEVLTVRNTGSSAGPTMTLQNNTSFGGDLGIRYEHVGIGGNSWIQGRYDSDSSFRIAFTGGQDAVLGTNDILTLATGGSVGIGTTTPDGLLHISGDQYQVQISGPDGQNKFIKINSSLGDNFVGFSESQNALMMLADDDAPVYIGQVSHQAIRVDKNGDRGSVVIGDDASRPAAGDEVLTVRNTGSSAGPTMTLQNNTSFGGDLGIRYEHVGIGGNSWIQGRYDSDSSFRFAYKNGNDAVLGTNDIITFTTGGDVGIGTHSPTNKLEVRGDARVRTLGDNQIALYMTTPDHSFGLIAQSGEYSQLFGGGPVKYSADGDTFLSVSGDRITVGNQATDLREPANAPVGFNIIPTDTASTTTVNLLSTGISFAGGNKDNLLNFVEQEYDNTSVYNKTRWTIGQVVTGLQSQPRDTGSYLVIGYKTGEGDMSLTGSDAIMTLSPNGNVQFNSGDITVGDSAGNNDFIVSGSKVGIALGSHLPAYNLHVSGTANSLVSKFEGDVQIGGDSASNATLTVEHTGSMGSIDALDLKQAAFLISGRDGTSPDQDDIILAFDNNQIVFSGGGASGPYAGTVSNTHGSLHLGGSLSYAPYTTTTNIAISDNGVNLGTATSFSGSYPVHISGGRSAGGVELRVEGDISAGDSLALGTTTPYGSAIIDCTSTTKAFLPPRMTATQRDAISSPIAGMVIYNTDDNVLNFHNGTTWGAV